MFRTDRGEFNWISFLLLFNIVIFSIYLLLGASGPLDEVNIYGIFNAAAVKEGYFWLFLTSNFLHFEAWHIFFNMMALFQIGNLIQEFYSSKKLFITYIVSGIISGIGTLIYANALNENIASLGASGAVFGLLGLLIGGTLKTNRYGTSLPFSTESFIPTLVLAVLIAFMPNVNWVAHIFGLIAGILLGFLFENNMLAKTSQRDLKLESFMYIFTIGIFVISYGLLIANLLTGFAEKL
ncbi:rhomboid family intramembrane serine protease [Candidatus Dojkabacteria bacterium]|uniref:Rhomboid family intramembrane serine protease n=1 Tax=Candidatus Dojkabacteria bacterium TaxID=2099670 RepID=A0A955LAC5_9BACT|nr:rhomboid family intramembrane serine protease [Candidatus Dojkabacteria bacterium]